MCYNKFAMRITSRSLKKKSGALSGSLCMFSPDTKNTTSDNLLNQRLQRWKARSELSADAMSNLHLGQVFNLLYEVNESVPIFDGFLTILLHH